jgi:retron-type reverse transcriptase
VRLLRSYLTGRSFEVAVAGYSSPLKSTNAGVPQGSSLSALLFIIFIDDLLSTTVSKLHAYADDTTLHSSIQYSKAPSTKKRLEDLRNFGTIIQQGLD